MLDRLGIQQRDLRNASIVVVRVMLVMGVVAEGPVPVRLVVGLVMGLVSCVVFLAATAVLNRVKPEYF
jgi:hypothetical protein